MKSTESELRSLRDQLVAKEKTIKHYESVMNLSASMTAFKEKDKELRQRDETIKEKYKAGYRDGWDACKSDQKETIKELKEELKKALEYIKQSP